MTRRSQTDRILAHMLRGYSISPVGALRRFRCFRLAARVYQLRQAGISIRCRMVRRNDKRYGLYSWR